MTKRFLLIGLVILAAVILLLLVLRPIFSGGIILPQVFHVGPLSVHYSGLAIACAVIAAYWWAARQAPRFGFTLEQLDHVLVILVVCGFIGARIYHVA